MNRVNKKFGSWTESLAQWLIHQMKLSARYCGNFEFITFSRRILERVFVGSIVNIRNECIFFWVHGKWIIARNKQIAREPLRGSRDLFFPRYDSFPHEPRKKDTHSLSIPRRQTKWWFCKVNWLQNLNKTYKYFSTVLDTCKSEQIYLLKSDIKEMFRKTFMFLDMFIFFL